MKNKATNEYETFLNECKTYVWEWYIPEQFVRFGIPSLNGLWIDDKEKIFRLSTVLERVHPDDIEKVLVRRTSPLYRSNEMFEVDIRLNLTGKWEWFGFRGMTLRRDKSGRPVYVRGVAINIDKRIRAQVKLLNSKDHQLQGERQKTDYCMGVMQEVVSFISSLAPKAEAIISGDSMYTREERLAKIAEMKETVAHVLELNDKVKALMGTKEKDMVNIRSLQLWEHLAELQQIYALKQPAVPKLYFSNQYDNLSIQIDVKLFDILIENVIMSQVHNNRMGGYLTMNYSRQADDMLLLCITCTTSNATAASIEKADTESGLGLSVCRLMAKRLWGDLQVAQGDGGKIHYQIMLPLDAYKASGQQRIKLDVLDEMEGEPDDEDDDDATRPPTGLPHVLIATIGSTATFSDQHLFDVYLSADTDDMLAQFEEKQPEIVFVDYNLRGTVTPLDAVRRIRQMSADTPIIVTSDYAHRVLHRQVRESGAQYLLANPLSLRKVNLMIRKYLK